MKWSPPQDSHLPSTTFHLVVGVLFGLVVLDISALAELRGEGLPLVKICAQHAIKHDEKYVPIHDGRRSSAPLRSPFILCLYRQSFKRKLPYLHRPRSKSEKHIKN